MQHSMRTNRPDVRDPAVLEEWEPRDPIPQLERALRASGALDDEGVAAIRREVEAEVETAIEQALVDDDADAGDLLPSVFVAHRDHPAPPPKAIGSSASSRRSARLSTSSSRRTRT
jgi:TPP-dependent pyruvate/acetoin dehydrogenase alpha subunit